jgi:hypothetical protein
MGRRLLIIRFSAIGDLLLTAPAATDRDFPCILQALDKNGIQHPEDFA